MALKCVLDFEPIFAPCYFCLFKKAVALLGQLLGYLNLIISRVIDIWGDKQNKPSVPVSRSNISQTLEV